jgi:ABC-2 type transport system permease protein
MTVQVAPPPAVGTSQDVRAGVERQSGWLVVAEQECRDLWTSGRGLMLLFLFSVLLSAVTYLTSTNQALNFLEQRESVNLVLQFAVAVGVLATLVVSADGISGERERGTLETLLVTPVSRRSIIAGKLVAALSLWFATFLVSIPYVWVLARGVGVLGQALVLGFCVGTLVAVGLGCIGLLISAACNSNKTSIAASIFLLLVLFAPTQLPSGLPQGWFFEVLLRANPVASGLAYISSLLVEGHSWTQDLSFLITPLLTAIIAGGALVLAGPRLVRLTRGVNAG